MFTAAEAAQLQVASNNQTECHMTFSSETIIRESVDSLCRDGADAQYMQ